MTLYTVCFVRRHEWKLKTKSRINTCQTNCVSDSSKSGFSIKFHSTEWRVSCPVTLHLTTVNRHELYKDLGYIWGGGEYSDTENKHHNDYSTLDDRESRDPVSRLGPTQDNFHKLRLLQVFRVWQSQENWSTPDPARAHNRVETSRSEITKTM